MFIILLDLFFNKRIVWNILLVVYFIVLFMKNIFVFYMDEIIGCFIGG